MKNQQRGGTILGLIFGMVIGLAAALAVAIYVTKVPVPFLNKGGNNTQRDAAEAERNKNWDPNAPLQSRQPAPPPVTPPVPPSDVTVSPPTPAVQPTATGGVTTPPPPSTPEKPAKPASGDPLGDLVKERSAAGRDVANVLGDVEFGDGGQGVAAGTHVLDLGAFDDQVFETSHSGGSRLVAHVDERDSGVESGHQ